MILEFTCSNYKSIMKKAKLSMMSTKSKEHNSSLLYYNDKGVLPIVALYGANGAGKTNLLNAIGYLHFMISNSNNFNPGNKIPFFPHKSSANIPSEFSIQISINGIRYAYGFSNNSEEIQTEYLYHFKNNRAAKIFDREGEQYSFGKDYSKDLNDIRDRMSKKNKLFLSLAANWINNKDIISVFNYLSNYILINTISNNEEWKNTSILTLKESTEYKDAFITLLQVLDVGITDIDVDVKEINVNYEDLPQGMPEELKMLISKSDNVSIDVKVSYDGLEINLNEESRGINKLFEIGIPILDTLRNGKVLVYDELESSIHPILVKVIVDMFKNKKLNSKNAQLIFSTHDSNILDLDLLRRDQIWFAEKLKTDNLTHIYSLVELKNIRNDENIENGYIRGKYGSIPFINENYLEKFNIKEDLI